MKLKTIFFVCFLIVSSVVPSLGQNQLTNFDYFIQPVGNWLLASNIQKDSLNPSTLIFEEDGNCFVNGVNGKAKYLVTKNEYQDIELHVEFMLPKGSNSGIYFQCRYEIQLFDSWGETNLTYYDCGGIQNRWNENLPEGEKGYDGFPPMINACKAPGTWQSLDVLFRAPTFNKEGEKIKNACFESVLLNGVVVQKNTELTGPTKGALSEEEVVKAPFRLQGGHGPVAFRNIIVRELKM